MLLHAQRIGKVFASATTWAKLVRERGWRRPRLHVHPARPTVGVRAAQPNETWHVDMTVLRLLDWTKAFLHAIIDNYSRKILASTVATRLKPRRRASFFSTLASISSSQEAASVRRLRHRGRQRRGRCHSAERLPRPRARLGRSSNAARLRVVPVTYPFVGSRVMLSPSTEGSLAGGHIRETRRLCWEW